MCVGGGGGEVNLERSHEKDEDIIICGQIDRQTDRQRMRQRYPGKHTNMQTGKETEG